jgi:hypothetical protein
MKFTVRGGRVEASTQVPESILKLVEKYEVHQAAYKRGQFNETPSNKQIDTLVYELYGLTDEEIRIGEGEGK